MTHPPIFNLGKTPETSTPESLLAFFKDHAASDVEVDLSETKSLSGRHLEIVLSAYTEWADAGHAVSLKNMDETYLQQLTGFGLPAPLFSEGK